jgi:hypothetical protein
MGSVSVFFFLFLILFILVVGRPEKDPGRAEAKMKQLKFLKKEKTQKSEKNGHGWI